MTKCTNGLKLNGGCIDNCPPSFAFVDGESASHVPTSVTETQADP